MEIIINMTYENVTCSQFRSGVVEPLYVKEEIRKLLAFDDIPSTAKVIDVAAKLAAIAKAQRWTQVMIGGSKMPTFLIIPLHNQLRAAGIRVLYSFSNLDNMENTESDGRSDGSTNTTVPDHEGFVEVF